MLPSWLAWALTIDVSRSTASTCPASSAAKASVVSWYERGSWSGWTSSSSSVCAVVAVWTPHWIVLMFDSSTTVPAFTRMPWSAEK